MTDTERLEFSHHSDKYIGSVMEIVYFGTTGDDGSFRHPNFIMLRPDKNPEECTWD